MKKILCLLTLTAWLSPVQASWYWPFEWTPNMLSFTLWPFGSDDGEENQDDEPKRISDLIEPASILIDEASDLAAEGKTDEAVAKYREVLKELDHIEAENPDRADSPEFATLKTKRAYVSATIDAMLLSQVREHAKPVTVSDTRELEKKLAAEKAEKSKAVQTAKQAPIAPAPEKPVKVATPEKSATQTLSRRSATMKAIADRDYETADRMIREMLAEKPDSAAALNLRAVMESAQERYAEAEKTLDRAIQSNPRDYHAYYNMAILFLKTRPDGKSGARRYYATGRDYGGPQNSRLEAMLK